MRTLIKSLLSYSFFTLLSIPIPVSIGLQTAFAAGPSSDQSDSISTGTSIKSDGSNGTTKTDTKSDGKGGQKSKTSDNGISQSTRKELRTAQDKMRDKGVTRTMPLVPLFVSSLSPKFPWLYTLHIDDLLTVSTNDGRATTYVQNLSTRAQAQGSADSVIKKDEVLATMKELQQLCQWIASVSGDVSPDDLMGIKDWKALTNLYAGSQTRLAEISTLEPMYNTSGTCRFIRAYTKIQCGECSLDMSRNRGVPELTCSGLVVFSPDSANGQNLSVSMNSKVSWSDSESKASSDEAFKRLTDSVNTYTKWAIDHSDAHAIAQIKSKSVDIATRSDGKVSSVIAALDHKEDPNGILSTMGIK